MEDEQRRLAEQVRVFQQANGAQLEAAQKMLAQVGRRAVEQYEVAGRELGRAVEAVNERNREQLDQLRTAVLSALETDLSGVRKLGEFAIRMVRLSYPPNWPVDVDLDIAKLEEIVQVDGIAVFYVPRASIVTELIDAADAEVRMKIVDQRCDEIAEDCLAALPELAHEEVRDSAVLVRKAVECFIAGHHEAAQALAVVVCDSYLKKYLNARYTTMREQLELASSDDEGLWTLLRFSMPLATAVPFLADWKSHDDPAPLTFSRHVTIHGASTAQLNRLHATLAIMLAATMTCAWDFGFRKRDGSSANP